MDKKNAISDIGIYSIGCFCDGINKETGKSTEERKHRYFG
jgi:hypothetical protein